ncbi:hypothetical protein [Luteolibacter marinus]|uniref:hypothetical protein n=1 Tax=Luteolibacter marinus TaxID=2776705 RepID=UPI001865E796|nr:hypothetical protein [Luteolibacter marinus]
MADDDGSESADPLEVRREHLEHETAVRALGWLLCTGGILIFALTVIIGLEGVILHSSPGATFKLLIGFAGASLPYVTGVGLRRLESWALPSAILFLFVGMLLVPIGTLLGGYGIGVLCCPRGHRILSGEYREIVARTPGVKWRVGTTLKRVLVIALLLEAAMIAWLSRQ